MPKLSADEYLDDRAILQGRHPAVAGVARFLLEVNPNLPAELARIAREYRIVARWLLDTIPDGPELAVALRKLLESKDAAVRAALPA